MKRVVRDAGESAGQAHFSDAGVVDGEIKVAAEIAAELHDVYTRLQAAYKDFVHRQCWRAQARGQLRGGQAPTDFAIDSELPGKGRFHDTGQSRDSRQRQLILAIQRERVPTLRQVGFQFRCIAGDFQVAHCPAPIGIEYEVACNGHSRAHQLLQRALGREGVRKNRVGGSGYGSSYVLGPNA